MAINISNLWDVVFTTDQGTDLHIYVEEVNELRAMIAACGELDPRDVDRLSKMPVVLKLTVA
jgi:hypothetical protein